MASALRQIRDWEQLAASAKYNVAKLADECMVSSRHLERFFATAFGTSPHKWLHSLRMRRALELLRDCSQVKEVAKLLGYKDATHLTHDFKTHFGIPPSKAWSRGVLMAISAQMSRFDRFLCLEQGLEL